MWRGWGKQRGEPSILMDPCCSCWSDTLALPEPSPIRTSPASGSSLAPGFVLNASNMQCQQRTQPAEELSPHSCLCFGPQLPPLCLLEAVEGYRAIFSLEMSSGMEKTPNAGGSPVGSDLRQVPPPPPPTPRHAGGTATSREGRCQLLESSGSSTLSGQGPGPQA